MKKYIKITRFTAMLAILLCQIIAASSSNLSDSNPEKQYYGIEVNGQLCGYSISTHDFVEREGIKLERDNVNVFLLLSLLGSEINTEMNFQEYIDPETKRTMHNKIVIDQGSTHRESEISIKNDSAYITPIGSTEAYKLEVPADIIFGDAHMIRRFKEDFIINNTREAVYTILSPMDGKLEKVKITNLGNETIELADSTYDTFVFEQVSEETALRTKRWVDTVSEELLQFEVSNRRVFKADRSVVDKIKLANMDASFITKTNLKIGDIQAISYMKIDAQIEPTGVKVTADNLNVPGQKFEGTVTNNVIEGIFEIEHKKYDGSNAPPLHHTYKEELNYYLSSGDFIESDDPVLIEKAQNLTIGAGNSWEAACRLSEWVAKNITYAIPGGGTPRNTYDMRAGECGAHSMLLATFCRAVGIPARVVWGAMYIPNFGGAFGQHAWTEIYMGDAGWIAVDATAFENDFLDSGHIRIGEYTSISTAFNGKSIKVLEHRLSGMPSRDPETLSKYEKFIGKYAVGDRSLFVKTENDALVLDIPGKAILPFNNPDENGNWYCKIAPQIYVEFVENEDGEVSDLNFHQLMTLQRKSTPDIKNEDAPEKVKPFIGEYNLPGSNYNFNIFCHKDTLYFKNIAENRTMAMMQTPESDKIWTDENSKTYCFDLNEEGIAGSVKIDVLDKLYKD